MIIIYTKPADDACAQTCEAFTAQGILYQERSLVDDPTALAHVKELGYLQAPVVETPHEHWSGHRPDKIAEYRR